MNGHDNLFLRPFFSDWESFRELIPELKELFAFKPKVEKAAKTFVNELRQEHAM